MSLDRLIRYEAFINQEIENGEMPGAVSLVMRRGELVHYKAFGESDVSTGRAMQPDDIFFIQSMTKPIITVALMMLYEEGHFQLNDPVSKYLPYLENLKVAVDVEAGIEGPTKPVRRPVTIAMLMSHTAGFSHGLGSSRLDRELMRGMYGQSFTNIEERVKYMAKQPLMGQPGEQWYYSAAPDVLSVLIEKFSGQTTEAFLEERLFAPLGMLNTGYNLDEDQQKRVVQVHTFDEKGNLIKPPADANGVFTQPPMAGNKVFSGVNALFSTAMDYARFCQMLLNGGRANGVQLLSPKTIEIMTMNQVGELFPDPGTGFGFGFAVVTDLAELKALGSEGQFSWSGANRTFFFVDPKEKLVAIFMTQITPYSNFYGDKMRQFVYQAIVD